MERRTSPSFGKFVSTSSIPVPRWLRRWSPSQPLHSFASSTRNDSRPSGRRTTRLGQAGWPTSQTVMQRFQSLRTNAGGLTTLALQSPQRQRSRSATAAGNARRLQQARRNSPEPSHCPVGRRGAPLIGLITLTFCRKESFILSVINLLKFKPGNYVGRDSIHCRVPGGHARGTNRNNVLIRRNPVARRQPRAQIPDSLIVRKPEAVARVWPHRALVGGDDQLVWTALLCG